jgi:hypothetical protein
MAGQTGFDVDDATSLLQQLQQFHEIIQQEWTQVQNQWGNLRSVWADHQYATFEPLFEQLSSTHNETDRMCDQFTAFLQGQIQQAEDRKATMGEL